MANAKKSQSEIVLRLFTIEFNCDLTSASSALIPLGVMGYIEYGDRFSLGLTARRALSEKEAKKLGAIARKVLAHPFDTLRTEQERVMATEDRIGAIQALVQSASSITYTPMPEQTIDAPSWVERKPQSREVQQYLKDELMAAVRDRYWEVVGRDKEDESVLHSHNFLREPEFA